MNSTTPELLTTAEAAQKLNVTQRFLDKARWSGTGPKFVKFGKLVRYRADDLQDYIDQSTRTWTRQEAA